MQFADISDAFREIFMLVCDWVLKIIDFLNHIIIIRQPHVTMLTLILTLVVGILIIDALFVLIPVYLDGMDDDD